MTTVSAPGTGARRNTPPVDAPATDAELELAQAVGDFAVAFDKWARSAIAADAPSLPRLKLLYALACEGPQRMGDLAEILEVTPRSVTALVDGLEGQGQVRRVADPVDRRATVIELVEGQGEIEQRFREHTRMVASLFDGLDRQDSAGFLRVCRELTARLRERDLKGKGAGSP